MIQTNQILSAEQCKSLGDLFQRAGLRPDLSQARTAYVALEELKESYRKVIEGYKKDLKDGNGVNYKTLIQFKTDLAILANLKNTLQEGLTTHNNEVNRIFSDLDELLK